MGNINSQVKLYGNTQVHQEFDEQFRKFCTKLSLIEQQVLYEFVKDNFGDYWLASLRYLGTGDVVLHIPPFVRGIASIPLIRCNTEMSPTSRIQTSESEERFSGFDDAKFWDGDYQTFRVQRLNIIVYNSGGNVTIVGPNKPLERSVRGLFHRTQANKVSFKSFDISKIPVIESMFTSGQFNGIDLGGINFGKPESLRMLVSGCRCLKEIDISGIDLQECMDLTNCFYQNMSLEHIKLPKCTIHNYVDLTGCFEFCCNLRSINIQDLNFFGKVKIYRLFYDCSNLKEIDLRNANNIDQLKHIINWCERLERLILNKDIVIDMDRAQVEKMLIKEQSSEQLKIQWV